MKNFDYRRFGNYARYDLTINRSFYRNMALITAGIILGLTLLCFMGRWRGVAGMSDLDPDSEYAQSLYTVTFTTTLVTIIVSIMMQVFAGCIHHPLRSKQSRISVLTLPATNVEKFVWHTLLVIVGGGLICFCSIVLADGVNALFSLLVGFPADKIYSITAEHLRYFTFSSDLGQMIHINNITDDSAGSEIAFYIILYFILAYIWAASAYAFGNAVKYRYNIIWTYIALQILQFVGLLLVIGCSFAVSSNINLEVYSMSENDVTEIFRVIAITVIVLQIVTIALMWWGNWHLYKKAQITSKINR